MLRRVVHVLLLATSLTAVGDAHAASEVDLTSIPDALRLSPEEAAAGRRVRLRAIVTYADPVTRDFFIADENGAGISMWYPDPKVALTQGDLVEIEGHTERGDYAPKIATPLTRLEVVAHDRPAPITRPTQAALTANGLDCRHIETDAVVRDVILHPNRVELRLASLLGPTRLLFATGVAADSLLDLAGAEVRVRATVGVDLNKASQRTGLRLYAQSLKNLTVVHPSQPLTSLPHRSLADLLRFQRTEQLDPRIVIDGDVIYAAGRQVFVADGDAVARLRLAEREATGKALPLGARVRAVGFVEPGDPLPEMIDAHIVSIGPPGATTALDVTGQALLREGLDDRLVRLGGRVVSALYDPPQLVSVETPRGPALVMTLEPQLLRPGELAEGAQVEVVGIRSRAADQITPLVLLRQRSDLRVLGPAPFWSTNRLLALAGGALALALFMVLKWRWTSMKAHELRRLVDERTAALSAANQALEIRSKDLEAQHQELVELHHVRARFIATAAHDLRSPLTAIIVGTPTLAREPDPTRRHRLANELIDATQNINRELNELVRAYRDEQVLLRSERVDLCAVVEMAVASARPQLERKGQVIALVRPTESVWAQGDAAIFGHVVLNLLSNASKFSAREKRVTVTVSPDPPEVRVSDEGVGLDAKNVARLFDRTERPDVRPTASEPTSGEGLLLCERWMKTMGGSISCESAPGKGSTFVLRLMPVDTPPRTVH